MPQRKPRRSKSEIEETFDSVYKIVVEGVTLYKKIKPLIKRKRKRKNDKDQSNNQAS